MDVRITPLSNFSSPTKASGKNNAVNIRDQFNSLNRNKLEFDKLHNDKPGTVRTSPALSKHTFSFIPAKKPRASNDNLLVLSKNKLNPNRLSIKITSSRIQPAAVAEKKGVLLYQQLERNKLFSNGTELINRFNFKA